MTKIIFLNIWDCQHYAPLEKWINKNISDTDIFCFQEVYDKSPSLLKPLFDDYKMYWGTKKRYQANWFFQHTYLKNNIDNLECDRIMENELSLGLGLVNRIKINNKIISICNVHGMPSPGDKKDNTNRIMQSMEIINFFRNSKNPVIIGGDFNLDINTKSVSLFEENGYRNLIKEYGIKNTRNRLAWEMYPENKQNFADFVFVTPDIKVEDFTVENNEVSDHLPMRLVINL